MSQPKNLGGLQKIGRNDPVWNNVYMPTLFPTRNATSGDDNTVEDIQWMLERTIMELSMNRFQWTGLPKEVSKRWLEMSCNFYGLAVFFKDPVIDKFMALRGSMGQQGLNMTGDPISFRVYGTDLYQRELTAKECVPIWANYMRTPDWDKIRIYAKRIAEMDRTIEINALNARVMKVLRTTENTRLSAQAILTALRRGDAAIELDITSLDPTDMVDVLDLGFDVDKSIMAMHIVRTREWQEIMNLLGLNSSNQDKKERLTAAETSGNDDIIAGLRATHLQARQEACDQINDMFPEIASLPENSQEKLSEEEWEIQSNHPGVWVQYVTDMKTATLAIDENGVSRDEQTQQEQGQEN